jgi:flagellar FliL protein
MSEHETTNHDASPAAAGKPGLISKVVVLAFLVAVIGGECLVACFYLPAVGAAVPASEHAQPAAGGEHAHEPDKQAGSTPSAATREVDLGKFSVTAFQPMSNTTLLIDFHLFAAVSVDPAAGHAGGGHGGGDHGHGHKDAGGDDEFSKLFKKHEHRLRDQVITIVRSAELADYADPSLGLIRRKILEKSNRTLGKPLIQEVIFSDFSLIEQ